VLSIAGGTSKTAAAHSLVVTTMVQNVSRGKVCDSTFSRLSWVYPPRLLPHLLASPCGMRRLASPLVFHSSVLALFGCGVSQLLPAPQRNAAISCRSRLLDVAAYVPHSFSTRSGA